MFPIGRYSLTGPLSVSGWTKAVSHLGRTTQAERDKILGTRSMKCLGDKRRRRVIGEEEVELGETGIGILVRI